MTPVANLTDDEFSHLVQRAVNLLPDAPLAMQRAATGLWPPVSLAAVLGNAAALGQGLVRQLAAVLSFDSWASPALSAGMRSGRSPARHLLFTAEGCDIDLRITPAGEGFALAGQVLGPNDQGRVELADPADAQAGGAAVALDGLGSFRFDGLARGRYVVTLRLGPQAIVLPPLEVGELSP